MPPTKKKPSGKEKALMATAVNSNSCGRVSMIYSVDGESEQIRSHYRNIPECCIKHATKLLSFLKVTDPFQKSYFAPTVCALLAIRMNSATFMHVCRMYSGESS